jgi:nitrogen fixation-related uncharacterized protein
MWQIISFSSYSQYDDMSRHKNNILLDQKELVFAI